MEPQGLLSRIGGMFYDGKVKWGGVAGTLLGGLAMFNLSGGLGGTIAGNLFRFAAIGVGALLGNWMGDRTTKLVSGFFKKSDGPDAPGKGNTKPLGPEGQRNRDAAMRAAEESHEAPEATSPAPGEESKEVDRANLGGFSPGTLVAATSRKPERGFE